MPPPTVSIARRIGAEPGPRIRTAPTTTAINTRRPINGPHIGAIKSTFPTLLLERTRAQTQSPTELGFTA